MRSLLASKSEVIRFRTVERYYKMALEAALWYNQGRNIVAPAVLDTPRSRIHLIGDVPMDTVPHPGLNFNLQQYYVYELAYPESMGGAVFYVGKGKNHGRLGDRIDDHEKQAQGQRYCNNKRKVAAIKAIWASGNEVTKRKVAFFDNELDAYMYEWALLNMMCYSEGLTNAQQKSPKQERCLLVDLPETIKPICIQHRTGKMYHRVSNPVDFTQKHPIKKSTMRSLLDGKYHLTWAIVPCECTR